MAGLTLTPGSTPDALRNLEEALVYAPTKELAKLRFSFKLKDGRDVNNVIVRAAMKERARRDDAMVDTIGKMRLEKLDSPSSESVWVEFDQIAGWAFDQLPTD